MGTWRGAVATQGVGVSRGAVADLVGSGGLGRSRRIYVGAMGMLLGLREGPWELRGLLAGGGSMAGGLVGSAMGGPLPPGGGLSGYGGRVT